MTFYQKVIEEFDHSCAIKGICERSKLFKNSFAIAENREKIIRHAILFHKEHHRKEIFSVDYRSFIFFEDYYLFSSLYEYFHEIRKEFLEWAIQNNLDI